MGPRRRSLPMSSIVVYSFVWGLASFPALVVYVAIATGFPEADRVPLIETAAVGAGIVVFGSLVIYRIFYWDGTF
jgi:hypothetical protein